MVCHASDVAYAGERREAIDRDARAFSAGWLGSNRVGSPPVRGTLGARCARPQPPDRLWIESLKETMIIAGRLVSTEGVEPGQIRVEGDRTVEVGPRLGRADIE